MLVRTSYSYEKRMDYENYEFIYISTVCVLSCSVVSDSAIPMDLSLPGFSVHGISQARILVDCLFLLQRIFLTD